MLKKTCFSILMFIAIIFCIPSVLAENSSPFTITFINNSNQSIGAGLYMYPAVSSGTAYFTPWWLPNEEISANGGSKTYTFYANPTSTFGSFNFKGQVGFGVYV